MYYSYPKPCQIQLLTYFKQMKSYFNVDEYGLVKQMIGKKKLWTPVRQSWHTVWSIVELKVVLEVSIHIKMQIDCLQLFHFNKKI